MSVAAEEKRALRRVLGEKLQGLTPEERVGGSESIRARLMGQRLWQEFEVALLYVPMAGEPDIWPLVTEAIKAGRKIALPRYVPAKSCYEACVVRRCPEELAPGRFGILEPNGDCPAVSPNQLDLALVPGVGFSLNGGRLGRGQGYYDRLLAHVSGFKCGVAYECQVTSDFRLEPHDIRLNGIVTPTFWHSVDGQAPVLK